MENTSWVSNHTGWSDFILLGFFAEMNHPILLCVVIFVVFLLALFGNSILVLLIYCDINLHTPMYILISQLSLMDVMYIFVTIPKMLMDQVIGVNTISVPECGIQMFLYVTLGASECFLLAAMAYDRYVAICRPLHYSTLMTNKLCFLLVSGCWTLGLVEGFMFTPVTMTFPFCGSREIHHFFCELPVLTKLSCADTSLYETLMYICCVLMLLVPVTAISSSYYLILLTIYRMNSAEGQRKAFVTCSSHMTVVTFFYGAGVYTYMLPNSYHTPKNDMVASVFYTIVTPVLNPLVYSFRNKEVTAALKKLLSIGFPMQ